jgi:hypothetical protein
VARWPGRNAARVLRSPEWRHCSNKLSYKDLRTAVNFGRVGLPARIVAVTQHLAGVLQHNAAAGQIKGTQPHVENRHPHIVEARSWTGF